MYDPQRTNIDGNFTRRSKTESVCMRCFLTVRAYWDETLDEAEADHAQVCIQRPGPPYIKQPANHV